MAENKKKRPAVVVIDLSDRATTAAVLQRDKDDFALLDYAIVEPPGPLETLSRTKLAQHLKAVTGALATKVKEAVLVVGVQNSIIRTVELPHLPGTNLRNLLKLNTAKYFKHDVSEVIFDCAPLTGPRGAYAEETSSNVLVVGITDRVFKILSGAVADAGLRLLSVTSRQVGLANACRLSRADSYLTEVGILIDIGSKTCAVSALIHGQPLLTRVVELDEKLRAELEEAFTTPYPVAEEIRTNLIRTRLQKTLFRVGQEISAAVDFFEAQLNCRVSVGLFAGGTERTDLIMETLQAQLDVPCHRIDPATVVEVAVPASKQSSAGRELPRLAGALGSVIACFEPDLVRINLLAESIEARAERRRDPVRLTAFATAAVVMAMLTWAGFIRYNFWQTSSATKRVEAELASLKKSAGEAATIALETRTALETVVALEQHATNRFLAAPALDALQHAVTDQIQVVRVTLQSATLTVPAIKPVVRDGVRKPGKRGYSAERVSLLVQAKSFGEQKAENAFMDAIAQHPYFVDHLRGGTPVTLKSRGPRQVDPLDPNKVYTLFTIECAYPERILGYEE